MFIKICAACLVFALPVAGFTSDVAEASSARSVIRRAAVLAAGAIHQGPVVRKTVAPGISEHQVTEQESRNGVGTASKHKLLIKAGLNPNLYFSEQNWAIRGSVAAAVNAGAYLKLRFMNSTTVSLAFDPTHFSKYYMTIAWRINDKYCSSCTKRVHGNMTTLLLDSSLNASLQYSIAVHMENSLVSTGGIDRWSLNPKTGVFVKGVLLDASAKELAPVLRSKRALFFGDSITEGVRAKCRGRFDLGSNSAAKTWVTEAAATLDAEYSQVAFGGQGWTVGAFAGVPPFFTPGNDRKSSWNKIFDGAKRTFDNLDYVFVLHGTNDRLMHRDPTNSIKGWLHSIRSAVRENTLVFLTVPFGQFSRGFLYTAFKDYQNEKQDNKTFFIDLGAAEKTGIDRFSRRTETACDGIHPLGGDQMGTKAGFGKKVVLKAAAAAGLTLSALA